VPLSLHDTQTYRQPDPQLTGEFVANVWVEPTIHVNVWGVVTGVPSTITRPEPVGLDVTVICKVAIWKFAVSVIGPLITTVAGLFVPV